MANNSKALLTCSKVHFGFQQDILKDVNCSFSAGEFVGLIGANGAGKTTLLNLLMGLFQPTQGEIQLNDKSLQQYSRKEISRHLSMVPQDTGISYDFTVKEVVAMGRNPYLGRFSLEQEEDWRAINNAIEKTDLMHLAERSVTTLSGGERQRVMIARAIAQDTNILLLDEATANLDISHQLEIMQLVQELAKSGHLIISSIHDLSMASRFCDRLILLSEGEVVSEGTPIEVLTEENMAKYFSVEAKIQPALTEGITITPIAPLHN